MFNLTNWKGGMKKRGLFISKLEALKSAFRLYISKYTKLAEMTAILVCRCLKTQAKNKTADK
jgi:cell division protein ZapA (FtsZ GTPase activity inhibitor)